ncbi:MAG TPA: DinB family protein [Acidobacteriaceae bacterium]|nr:DinB family protein [Acidobacteriaceae bacterium]
MQKDLLLLILEQNRYTSHFSFDKVTAETAPLRLNEKTASIGFIYRHIGETMNLFGQFFGIPTDVKNSTMGQTDTGQPFDVDYSRELISRGYEALKTLIENSADEDWLKPIDTPFFGTVPRIRLFAHVLFHNSHHAGQISLTLSKGSVWPRHD